MDVDVSPLSCIAIIRLGEYHCTSLLNGARVPQLYSKHFPDTLKSFKFTYALNRPAGRVSELKSMIGRVPP